MSRLIRQKLIMLMNQAMSPQNHLALIGKSIGMMTLCAMVQEIAPFARVKEDGHLMMVHLMYVHFVVDMENARIAWGKDKSRVLEKFNNIHFEVVPDTN